MTLFTSPVRTIRTELRAIARSLSSPILTGSTCPLVVFTHFDGQYLPVKI